MRNLGDTLTPHCYCATFVREGTRGRKRNSLLISLRDDSDHLLCDHLWVNSCKAFERLAPGDLISFIATPVRYIKGYSGRAHTTSDFVTSVTLTDFKKVRVVGHNPMIEKKIDEHNESEK